VSDDAEIVSLALLRGTPLAEKLRSMLAMFADEAGGQEATVWLIDVEGEHMLAALNHGATQTIVEAQVVPTRESVVGFVALCAVPVLIGEHDNQHPAVMEATGTRVTAMIAVPIRVADTVIGTLSIVNPSQRKRFGSHEMSIASDYAREIGSMVEVAIGPSV